VAVNVVIERDPFETIDFTLRRFKKLSDKADVLTEYRRSTHFIPRGERRRHKSQRARKRVAKI